MIFSWLFSIVSLVCLWIAQQYAMLAPGTEPLMLSLSLIVVSPWMIPLVHELKKDITPLRPLFSRTACVGYTLLVLLAGVLSFFFMASHGTILFWSVLFFAVFFGVDGRIFFSGALAGLIVTILALLCDLPLIAEQASILVYLALVIGVIVELASPYLDRFHSGSPILLSLSAGLRSEYQSTLRAYSSLFAAAIGISYVILLVGRTTVWDFDLAMLGFFSVGVWIFAMISLMTHNGRYGITQIRDEELGWLDRYIPSRYRYIAYPLISGAIIGILVDIAYFRVLPLWIQLTSIVLTLIIFVAARILYPRILGWIRSSPYTRDLFI